jgi:hypothetical protein
MRRFASFVNCFLQNWSIDTFKHKTDKYSNQNKLISVHFQEMPEFKGKRKKGLTLTLYKKTFRYRLLCLKVSIYQFCRKQLTKLANLLMHSQCALSEPISSSRVHEV